MSDLDFVEADETWRERLGREWGPVVAAHMHLSDGFTLLARHDDAPVGLIAIVWRELPPPLPPTVEAFIGSACWNCCPRQGCLA